MPAMVNIKTIPTQCQGQTAPDDGWSIISPGLAHVCLTFQVKPKKATLCAIARLICSTQLKIQGFVAFLCGALRESSAALCG